MDPTMMDKEKLYMEYYSKVTAYVRGRIQNPQDAEDVISEVFLKVYASLDKYDEKKAGISTWIYTITHNTVVSYYEKRQRERNLQLEWAIDSTQELGYIETESYDCDEMLNELAEALETLPKLQRDIVILHYYFGLDHKQIAEKVKLSYANTRKQCSLAIGTLRNKLKI